MTGASELADSCPKVTFVLAACRHAGGSFPRGLDSSGAAACGELAARPNVVCKLSALGTFIHRNDPDHIAAVVKETVGVFGPERCLFGSNFPIEKLWTRYSDLVAAYRRALEPFGEAAARAALHDTAARVYRPG